MLPLLSAAICFAAGGLLMKASDGLHRPLPTIGFLLLFAIGAMSQAWAMRHVDMGVVYVAVLGLEAVLAVFFSAVVLGERITWQRGAALLVVLIGVVWLRRS